MDSLNSDIFEKEEIKVAEEYGISRLHAGCYLANGGRDEWICKIHNGGCKRFSKCKKIFEHEQEK